MISSPRSDNTAPAGGFAARRQPSLRAKFIKAHKTDENFTV
jgi:hypothetical protein